LTAEKIEMLTFIYTNSALLDEQDKTDYIKHIAIGELFPDDPDDGSDQIESLWMTHPSAIGDAELTCQ
jgi:hypothetical protein